MITTTFTSLHGFRLTGTISHEKKIKRNLITFVRKLGKIYATTDNYSLVEVSDDTDIHELERLVIAEL